MTRESNILKLNPASFEGVPFLVPDEKVERGQKVVLHEYPNSDHRFAEPMGKIPPIITLTCIVHGENYFQDRDNLERVLEDGGVGELVHPIYGALTVQVGPFDVVSNQRRVGEFIFTVTFYTSIAVSPKALPPTPTKITELADVSRESILTALGDSYVDPLDGIELDSDVLSINDVLDSIQDGVDSVVGPITSALAEVNSNIASFKNKAFRIMQTAQGLRSAMEQTMNSLVQLTLLPGQLKSAWDEMLSLSKPSGPTNTEKRKRTSNNEATITESNNLLGLAGSYEAIAHTVFNTAGELEESISEVDAAYTELLEDNNNPDENIILLANDPVVRESLTNLKVATRVSLDDQLTNIWRVAETTNLKSSMSLANYAYYGNIDNIDTITELNPNINVLNFNQKISVVTK